MKLEPIPQLLVKAGPGLALVSTLVAPFRSSLSLHDQTVKEIKIGFSQVPNLV